MDTMAFGVIAATAVVFVEDIVATEGASSREA